MTLQESYVDEPLFDSTYHALNFAYHFDSASPARPVMNRMSDGPSRPGKGLSGLDGAGQAGMIKAEVSELDALGKALIVCKFAPHAIKCGCSAPCCCGWTPNREWTAAVHDVANVSKIHISEITHFHLRRAMIARFFGSGETLSDAADRCGVHRNTASKGNGLMVQWLKEQVGRALHEVDGRMRGRGIVAGD